MDQRAKKVFLIILSISLLSALGTGSGLSQAQEPTAASALRGEINLLNLLNGLELTPAQEALFLDKAEEAKKLEDRWREDILSRESEMVSVLTEIKSCLGRQKDLPEELALNFHRLEDGIKAGRVEVEIRKRELAAEVRAALLPHQLYQLERFVPCIIPPKGESRVGQAADNSGLVHRLERIRNLPEGAYLFRRDQICRSVFEGFQKRFPRSALDEKEALGAIGRVLDRCRSLSEAEFELGKPELAEDLVAIFKPEAKAEDIDRKIEHFLLSEQIIPLLRERLQG